MCPQLQFIPNVAVAIATVGSFQFVSTGHTRKDALSALMDAWRTHADQYGSDPDFLAEEDVTVLYGPLGASFRDGGRMSWPLPPGWN